MSRMAVVLLMGLLSGTALPQAPVASHAPTAAAIANTTASPAVPASAVVAQVNGVALTQADLSDQEQAIFPYFRMHGGQIPPSAEPEIRRLALHKIVLNELLYQEARRRNLTIPAAKMQKGLRELRRDFSSPQDYQAAVVKKYGSEVGFRTRDPPQASDPGTLGCGGHAQGGGHA